MKIILAFLPFFLTQVIAVSFFDLVQEEWKSFKLTHRKQYDNEIEERLRMKIYVENAHKVAKHNQKFEIGLVSYKLKLNQFADMLHHEFVHTVNGFNRSQGLLSQQIQKEDCFKAPTFIPPAHVKLPDQVDWREKGAVTEVKDQGHCGSCWSFSATGSLEGQHFRKYGKLVSLSEQNLIDCSGKYGNNGCNGGLMDNAFRYIKNNGGIDTEKTYPYEGEDDKCRYNPRNAGADDKGFMDISQGDEEALKAAVATVGPISVAIDASHENFQFYSEGVYYDEECSSEQLDHGVLAVGYGTTEDGTDYWLVKNSWGPKWGDSGYIKMARNKDNNCGIASSASYPLI
ncbi:cathepsin L [Agrilus planipennis]|uniref:Cathepsin L n=1 Tax=Agrilus planipennis TaxID=224129 RepID=A0A1W4X5C5_AGRPL|nr:cathepsin L [Agrilus planipennis]